MIFLDRGKSVWKAFIGIAETDLWGVDDLRVRQKIKSLARSRAIRRCHVPFWLVLMPFLAAGLSILCEWVLNDDYIPWCVAITVLVGMSYVSSRFGRQLRQEYISVLEDEGRCISCGYLLTPSESRDCPECGAICAASEANEEAMHKFLESSEEDRR